MSKLLNREIRKGMRELKQLVFPWRNEYGSGFRDAIERCSEMIEKQMRIYNKAKREYLKKLVKKEK